MTGEFVGLFDTGTALPHMNNWQMESGGGGGGGGWYLVQLEIQSLSDIHVHGHNFR